LADITEPQVSRLEQFCEFNFPSSLFSFDGKITFHLRNVKMLMGDFGHNKQLVVPIKS